jgi:hypothetical protein
MYNEFKNLEKWLRIAMGLYFPTEEAFSFFFKTGIIAACFHRLGKVF